MVLLFALLSQTARADAKPSHFQGRLGLGVAYLANDSKGNDAVVQQSGAGLATQLDLGVRLLSLLSVHANLFTDYAPSTHHETLIHTWPLAVFGLGAGAALHLWSLELSVSAGVQFTNYTNSIEPESVTGAGAGPYVSGTIGYVWTGLSPLALGVHLLARYRTSHDQFGEDKYDLFGYHLGALISVGYDGKPVL